MCCCCCCSKQLPAAGGHSNGFHITSYWDAKGEKEREEKTKRETGPKNSNYKLLKTKKINTKIQKGAKLLELLLLLRIEPTST
jgi:hypothetical protein